MKFEVELAKDGNPTLKINDKYIYSKYAPVKEAINYILKEFDENAAGYILVGLGLGYHLQQLSSMTQKEIILLPLDEQEYDVYLKHTEKNLLDQVEKFTPNQEVEDYQIFIPNAFLKAVGDQHPLYDFLHDIKIRQRSFKTFSGLLEANFKSNVALNDETHIHLMNIYKGRKACLISSGPSLDDMIQYVVKAKESGYYILAVGSALKVLLAKNITPDAVIISDGKDNIQRQLANVNYNGVLYYLSTANHGAVLLHQSERIMLLQQGYHLAEQMCIDKQKLLETGGSVATTAFSLLEYMGFEHVILFGQDLGFAGELTHSSQSTSVKKSLNKQYRKILSNNNEYINTQPNLYSYLRWFEQKFSQTNVKVFNTALYGAKIKGVTFVNEIELQKILTSENSCI